jgi:NAD(P)H dehydrogenase (quinone)
VIDAEEWVASQLAAGRPEPMARFTLGMYQAAAAGFFSGVDPLLEQLLARPAQTARDALAQSGPR